LSGEYPDATLPLMATWRELEQSDPEMAEAGRALLYRVGVGLAFLGTVRKDGVARLHPVCPVLTDDEMYLFVIPSLKREDLLRDGRCALHSFPTDDNEDAFGVTGRATLCDDPATRERLATQFSTERSAFGGPRPADEDLLFVITIDSCFHTRTKGHGDAYPEHRRWRAAPAR
jgi:hypothetical protein